MLSVTFARRPGALIGAAIALVGIASFATRLGSSAPSAAWMLAMAALLTGALLIALATPQPASHGLYAGVASGLARDAKRAWAIRAAVVLTAPAAGAGVIAYALAALWEALNGAPTGAPPLDWRRTAGTGMLGLAVVLAADAAGLAIAPQTIRWALLLIGSGLALFWGAAGVQRAGADEDAREHTALRTGLGLVLAVAGVVLVLSRTLSFHHASATIAATVTSLAVLALVGGPWWLRTQRLLSAERIARARAQERAEMADQLHDSVLQTLALIQRSSDDPAAVVALARRQEQELRDLLLGRRPSLDSSSLADALSALARDIEDSHGAEFDVVTVGDATVDERVGALLAATREALLNAATHAPGAPVSVFARVERGRIMVYVHDRGPGFVLADIPPERHGVRESIIGRMRRNGGDAEIRSEPGAGCEVILSMERG